MNSQQQLSQQGKSGNDETNNQYYYTFTPSQLESLKKNV